MAQLIGAGLQNKGSRNVTADHLERIGHPLRIAGKLHCRGICQVFFLTADGRLDKTGEQTTQPTQYPQGQADHQHLCRHALTLAVTAASMAPPAHQHFADIANKELHKDWTTRLKYIPFLMSIGIGLTVNNTRAVLEALFNRQSEFTRTPKYRIEGQADEWINKKYRRSDIVQPMIELSLGLYFTATVFYALANGIYGTVPFLVLFQVGFLYTALLSIVQQFAGGDVVLKPEEV